MAENRLEDLGLKAQDGACLALCDRATRLKGGPSSSGGASEGALDATLTLLLVGVDRGAPHPILGP